MKKKVALFAPKLYGGGAERVVSRLSFALSDYYEVYVLIYNDDKFSYECGSKLINLASGVKMFPFRVLCSIANINRVIKENDIDIVISFLDTPNIINGLFNHSSIKIVSLRAYYTKETAKTIKEHLLFMTLKRAFNKANMVLTLSARQNEILVDEMNISIQRIQTVDNPYDIQDIIKKSEEKIPDDILQKIGHNASVAIGRLSDQKNYPELLTIFKKVINVIEDAKLVILGEGELLAELQKMCSQLEISSNVLFLNRVDNPFPYIANSKVYISTSKYEGFPNSLVEAMACGIPVMQCDCPTGPREIMNRNVGVSCDEVVTCEMGLLLPFLDVNEKSCLIEKKRNNIANAWIRMLADDEYRESFSAGARNKAIEFDSKLVVNQYVRLIEQVICS